MNRRTRRMSPGRGWCVVLALVAGSCDRAGDGGAASLVTGEDVDLGRVTGPRELTVCEDESHFLARSGE